MLLSPDEQHRDLAAQGEDPKENLLSMSVGLQINVALKETLLSLDVCPNDTLLSMDVGVDETLL